VRRAGWLSRDEHLARLDQLLEDRLSGQLQLALVESEYRQERDKRIREKTEARPFRPNPALDEKILLYRQVLQALEAYPGSLIQPAMLNDPRLESSHKKPIRRCRRSCERARHAADHYGSRDNLKGLVLWKKGYCKTINEDKQWGLDLALLRAHLQGLEQEWDRLKAAHDCAIRSEVETELGLVVALAASASESCSEADIRNEYVERVLDLLLALPASQPFILDDEVHRLLELAEDRLLRRTCVAAPAVVAHASRLVAMAQYTRAGVLLDRLAAAKGSPRQASWLTSAT
jgi:hypothetical protein